MKDFKEFLVEKLNKGCKCCGTEENEVQESSKIKELEKKLDKVEDKAEKAQDEADKAKKDANKAEESIKDEKSFRDYAENKFKKVFGDDLDKNKMKSVIDGILSKHKDAVDKGDWGKLIGVLNKSFGV